MRIVWLSWKDRKHPQAGGAELVTDQIVRRLIEDGHDVTLLTADYPSTSTSPGNIRVVRVGGRYTVYFRAWRYYRKHLQDSTDLVIDEMNTIPFFAGLYAKTKSIMMVHQLARRIWFYQLPWFVGWIGYMFEPIYLFLLRKQAVITVSESTRQDLLRYGFKASKIRIISEGIELERLASTSGVEKYDQPTMLSLGAMRAMKRTTDQVKAFEIAKKNLPDLQLKIACDSNDPYGRRVLRYIKQSPFKNDIQYLGRVGASERVELMQKSHFIAVTSVKEGWGLIVSEAASQGTPAVVYDVDGLRDSVQHGKTGLIAASNTPYGLSCAIEELLVDSSRYERLRRRAWQEAESLTFAKCYRDFLHAAKELV